MTDEDGRPAFRVGAVFGQSFGLFGRNLVPFLILAAVIHTPTLLFPNLYGVGDPNPADGWLEPVNYFVVVFLVDLLATAVIVHAVVQGLRGQPIGLGASLVAATRRAAPLVLMLIVTLLAVGLGFVLFVVPALFLMAIWFVAIPCCVIEGQGAIACLGRSRDLTGGRLGPVFGILVLSLLASILISSGIEWLYFDALSHWSYLAVSFLWSVVSAAFHAVLVAVTYHDLRVAKEGIDIEQIAAMFE